MSCNAPFCESKDAPSFYFICFIFENRR